MRDQSAMAKDEELAQVQSSVQYAKFDNDDDGASEDPAPSIINGNSTKSMDLNNPEQQQQQQQQQQNGAVVTNSNLGPEVVDTPEQNDGDCDHQVVLQMNSLPSNGQTPELTDEPETDWNWYNLVLSVCSIFCCTVCGILATVTSILAYIDFRIKDYEGSRSKRVAAYALALTALIAGVICMVVVIVVALHFEKIKGHV